MIAAAAPQISVSQGLIVSLAIAVIGLVATLWSTRRTTSVQETGIVFAGQQHFVTSVIADNEQLRIENHDLHGAVKAFGKRVAQLEAFIRSLGKDPPDEA